MAPARRAHPDWSDVAGWVTFVAAATGSRAHSMAKAQAEPETYLLHFDQENEESNEADQEKRLEKRFSRSSGARMEPMIAARTAMAKAKPILRTIIRPLVCSRHVNANGLEARLL